MSVADELLKKLKAPNSDDLLLSVDDSKLSTPDFRYSFQVRNGIPVFLSTPVASDSNFNYQEHYVKDAEAFDYSKELQDPEEKIEVGRLRQLILSEVPQDAEWILDAGCGSGWLAAALIPKNRKVISMDISYRNPEKAVGKTPSPNHFAVAADALALPFKNDSLDCIVASEIIEHIVDPELFIRGLMAALKPGGKLIITTPYNEIIRYTMCIHCNQLTPHHAHLHTFTEQSIKNLVNVPATKINTYVFNSKLAFKLKLGRLFSWLPFSVWRFIDRLFLLVTGKKAYRLMLTIVK